MKRKLNEDNTPTATEVEDSGPAVAPQVNHGDLTFQSLGLDPRLLQAIAKENFPSPTPVQAKSIPLALEGKDVLGRRPFHCGSS